MQSTYYRDCHQVFWLMCMPLLQRRDREQTESAEATDVIYTLTLHIRTSISKRPCNNKKLYSYVLVTGTALMHLNAAGIAETVCETDQLPHVIGSLLQCLLIELIVRPIVKRNTPVLILALIHTTVMRRSVSGILLPFPRLLIVFIVLSIILVTNTTDATGDATICAATKPYINETRNPTTKPTETDVLSAGFGYLFLPLRFLLTNRSIDSVILSFLEGTCRHLVQPQDGLVRVLDEHILAVVHLHAHVDDRPDDAPAVIQVQTHLVCELLGIEACHAQDHVTVAGFRICSGDEAIHKGSK